MELKLLETVTQLSYALDTFYFLVCGALVMWMAAGFTMLEAGLVRAKNTTVILTKNIALYSIACVIYMLCGYQIMYAGSDSVILPGLGFLIGQDHSPDAVLTGGADAPYYSVYADFFFQVVFVATAMSIVSGAVAERMKLWSFLLFTIVLTGFIYPVQGYWKWGGGFLDQLGFIDFAGSGVVHLSGASAAFAAVLLLGPRSGKYQLDGKPTAIRGANMPLATLGTLILWLGWFGFNGGSELKISNIIEANAVAQIFVNTNLAAAGGVIVALLVSRLLLGRADLSMTLNGAIAGLVAITAEPLNATPVLAVVIGGVGGAVVVAGMMLLDKLRIDDPVGAIAAHGISGVWGLLAVPLSNPDSSFGVQLFAVLVIFGWVFLSSLSVWMLLKATLGIRVSEAQELHGVDAAECGIPAYPEFVLATSSVTSGHSN